MASSGLPARAPLLSFGCLALLSGLASGCQRRGKPAPTPPPEPEVTVTTVTVEERSMPRFLALTGSLIPNESSDVAANATGAVLLTQVERGSLVEKGDVLARLDARTAVLSTAEAEASAAQAKAQLGAAKTECERVEKLLAANAITGIEYDKQHAQCETAMWAARVAEARVSIAKKGLGDATVRAPFAGMVAERYVSAGEYVQPPSKVARIVSIDPLRLELTVPEQWVSVVTTGLPVDFQVGAFAGQSFQGSIRYIGPTLRASSRDLLVEAVVPNEGKKLRPGMFATAKIGLGEGPAPVVPKSALRVDGALARLFFVVEGRVEERLVKLGGERDGFVQIEQGAKVGEKVVAPLGPDVRDGVRVQGSSGAPSGGKGA